jgi:hypothetical protein
LNRGEDSGFGVPGKREFGDIRQYLVDLHLRRALTASR